jgi:hypothetical protein
MTDPQPLWEAMRQASDAAMATNHPFAIDEQLLAAEIRAVAEWIEKRQVEDYVVTLPDVREVIGLLRAEAERAEQGK